MSDIAYSYRLSPFSRFTYMGLKTRDSAFSDQDSRSWQSLISQAMEAPKASEMPECCRLAHGQRLDTDEVVAAAFATEGSEEADGVVTVEGFSLLNPIMRAWGLGPLSFTPCSFRCEAAKSVAEVSAGGILEVFERLGEMASLWDSWRGVVILKTPVLSGDCSTIPLRDRRQVRFVPIEEHHHPYGVVPWGVHGTEFPYLTRREFRRKLLTLREVKAI